MKKTKHTDPTHEKVARTFDMNKYVSAKGDQLLGTVFVMEQEEPSARKQENKK